MAIYAFGPFRLDEEQLLLRVDEHALPLGPKVVETLLALVERPGQVVGKAAMLERVWPDGFVEEANLAQNIYVIRKTLRRYWDHEVIETIPRRGYRFAAQLGAWDSGPAPASAASRAAPRRRFAPFVAAASLAVALAGLITFAHAGGHARQAPVLSGSGARLYAIGLYYWNQRTPEAIAKSERYFESVIQSDPHVAAGYGGLASAHAIAADYGFGGSARKTELAQAATLAQKALALDPSSAQAYAVLGLVAVDRGKMTDAFRAYRRAITLDLAYAPAHQWYGAALLTSGNAAEGYRELQRAAELDPSSVAATDWLAQAAFIARRYRDALDYGRQALDLSPQRYDVHEIIGMAYEALGNERAAIASYKTYAQSCRDCRYNAAALLAHAYALARDRGDAQAELSVARRGLATHAVAYDNYVWALVALGRKGEALDLMHRGKFDEPAALLAIDPRMDALRSDQRFRRYTRSPG